ncbi:MAG: GNAT N-acetyltransferase [Candidatus Micrarchaeota archaeon]|nr:GNAT N-acetyltransferase [Candidatus Micrarchaeota archaeon]
MSVNLKIAPLTAGDRHDLIENYNSYLREARRDPGFGISFVSQNQTLREKNEWFDSLLQKISRGEAIASVAKANVMVMHDDETSSQKLEPWCIGLCQVEKHPYIEDRHCGEISVSVIKSQRGNGVGEALMREVIDRAKAHLELLHLSVYANNTGAIKLYNKLGFITYGTVPNGLKRDGTYFDVSFMYLPLK